jgi:hypothetical protein
VGKSVCVNPKLLCCLVGRVSLHLPEIIGDRLECQANSAIN